MKQLTAVVEVNTAVECHHFLTLREPYDEIKTLCQGVIIYYVIKREGGRRGVCFIKSKFDMTWNQFFFYLVLATNISNAWFFLVRFTKPT